MGNYAVRLGQKPVRSSRLFWCTFLIFEQLLVDLDCAGGLSNIPGSICAATMTRVIPPVSSWVSQPWHRAPLAFFVAHEKPDSDPDAFLNAVTCVEKHYRHFFCDRVCQRFVLQVSWTFDPKASYCIAGKWLPIIATFQHTIAPCFLVLLVGNM